jgi:hypothetical protein
VYGGSTASPPGPSRGRENFRRRIGVDAGNYGIGRKVWGRDLRRLDDESFGSVSNELKRVAGDQSQRRMTQRLEHLDVVRIDFLNQPDFIMMNALDGRHRNLVSPADLSQGTEERIAMRRKHDITRSTRESCGRDVPRPFAKNCLVVTLNKHNRQAEPGYFHATQHGTDGRRGHGRNSFRRHSLRSRSRRLGKKPIEAPALVDLKNDSPAVVHRDIAEA